MTLLTLALRSTIALQRGILILASMMRPADCGMNDNSFSGLTALLADAKLMVFWVGTSVFVISVAVAGIMRMTAFSNERRVGMSNMALVCAVIGLIIMLLSAGLQAFITNSLGCPVQ